jgi:acetoin utilization deacetylase AcuC-like enzyme
VGVAVDDSMGLVIPYVWSPDVLRHEPLAEVWVGKQIPGTETAARAETIRTTLRVAGHPEVPAVAHPDDVLLAVHEPAMIEWLSTAAKEWTKGPYAEQIGQDRVVPHLFPTPMMTSGMPWRYPQATDARAGVWCYDTMTLLGDGTWEATRAAVDCALTAADLVVGGARAAYALTRPPGHHATPAGFGGRCYLNHAAAAAMSLAAQGLKVAVLDIDAYHGNGTQAVFWQSGLVFYGSVHVDPDAGWFPHIQGFADETGDGAGEGGTLNVPLPPGAGDEEWLDGVLQIAEATVRFGAQAVVISLGANPAVEDPHSPLAVTSGGFLAAGRLLASLELPTVLVQEGGSHLPSLGGAVARVLQAF